MDNKWSDPVALSIASGYMPTNTNEIPERKSREQSHNALPVTAQRRARVFKAACKRTQHCWMLHVASLCTPCYMLLDVVNRFCAKFETGQTFSPVQTDATLLALLLGVVASVCTLCKKKISLKKIMLFSSVEALIFFRLLLSNCLNWIILHSHL